MLRKLPPRPQWQIALTFTVALRIVFSAIAAVLSFFLHPVPALIRSNALTDNLPRPGTIHYALLGVWERFDTLWYLHIAQHGYDQPMAVIFYPLYPSMIRVVGVIMPSTLASLVISTAAAFFCFWGLLRLAQMDGEAPGRMETLLWLAVWPSSFVLFAGYAESLTLGLIVWAVIFARQQRWEFATFCGCLAGLSRPSGVLVAIPLFVLAWRSRRLRSLIVILSPIGLLSYWVWLRWSGRLSVVEAYRIYQGATFAPPWASLAEIFRLVVGHGDALLGVKFVLVALAFGLQPAARSPARRQALCAGRHTQMLMYTGRPLLGGPRYVLPMYPAFLAIGGYAARLWSRKQFGFYLACCGCLNLAWMWAFLDWSLVF
jgi:hypothetical protein